MGLFDIGEQKVALQVVEGRLETLIQNDRVIFAEMQKQTALLERIATAAEQTARATDHMARQRV